MVGLESGQRGCNAAAYTVKLEGRLASVVTLQQLVLQGWT